MIAEKLRLDYIVLGLIVLISSVLFFHNLGNNYITHWDEVEQLNVVKNLAGDCCIPKLHLQEYNTDFRNWTDNYIWLHKPLMPLLVNSVFFKIFGENLWAFRLPNVVFIELAIILLFLIGKKLFSPPAAIIASSLFAFNHYTFELVQGRQFSGISDITLIVFLLLGLYFIIKIAEDPKRKYFIWFGVFEGLAFLCKDGLALVPFLVLLVYLFIKDRSWPKMLNFLYAIFVCLVIIAPEKIYLAIHFPAQSTYEAQVQLAHIYSNVEYWARPWFFYFKDYWRILFGTVVGVLGYVALGYSIIKAATFNNLQLSINGQDSEVNSKKLIVNGFVILPLWVLCYLIPLTLMVSKISNFLYPVVPVIYLLVGAVVVDIWHRVNGGKIIKLLPVTIVVILISRSVAANLQSSTSIAADYQYQVGLRQASLEIKNKLPMGSLVLVDWPGVDKSHLYFKYWSDYEAFEIYFFHPAWDWLNLLSGRTNIYLLSEKSLEGQSQAMPINSGFIYKLR